MHHVTKSFVGLWKKFIGTQHKQMRCSKQFTLLAVALFTFSDAERVVPTGNKVIKCNKEVRVTLRRPQQVFFGAPAHRFRQCC